LTVSRQPRARRLLTPHVPCESISTPTKQSPFFHPSRDVRAAFRVAVFRAASRNRQLELAECETFYQFFSLKINVENKFSTKKIGVSSFTIENRK
jgi:hypothetical protein